MRELLYELEFLSDVVLPASSNTEGNIEQLEFVAGSNFLGMVAAKYNEFEDSFKVFHSGAVKFGDATLLYKGKKTYKTPLSFFHEKAEKKEIFNHHLIEDFSLFEQLKQKRSGYITDALEIIYPEYNYSQKSAYDKEHRRSKEGSMFGYTALREGSKWLFSIKCDESVTQADIALIQKSIEGEKRLGKSKSAQYGLVRITPSGIKNSFQQKEHKNFISLYFNSRVALVDEQGNPTYNLQYLFKGLKEENILYEKSQIKTSTFTPYNRARATKDYERACINSGSVIVLQDINANDIPVFVGVYQSEGFGEVLVNPSFLSLEKFELQEVQKEISSKTKQEIKSNLARFLQERENSQQNKLDVLKRVDIFIEKNIALYKNIKASQWGKIRSICTSGVDDFKDEIEKYISHGSKEWNQKQIEALFKKSNDLEFIKLISIQIPKRNKGTEND